MFRENSNDLNDSTLVSLNNIVNEFLQMEKKSKSKELNSNSKIYCSQNHHYIKRQPNHDEESKDSKCYDTNYSFIRARKIKYLENPAIAVYFQNMTQHIK